MFDPDAEAAENARLIAIRSALLDEDALVAASEARRYALLAECAEIAKVRTARLTNGNSREREMQLRSIAAEMGAAARVSDRTMQSRMGEAEQMMRLFPATVEALADARISRGHAQVILDTGCGLADEVRAEFEQTMVRHAESDTPARTQAVGRRLAELLQPSTIDERAAIAEAKRSAWVTDLPHGQAILHLQTAATYAYGILDRLTRQAKALEKVDAAARRAWAETKAARAAASGGDAASPAVVDGGDAAAPGDGDGGGDAGAPGAEDGGGDAGAPGAGDADGPDEEEPWFDERTRDQKRADILVDMALTGTPYIDPTGEAIPNGLGAIRAQVQITVPVTTLTGVTTGGGELDGRAPVDTETARRLAGDAPGWERVMTDPVRGTVLEVDGYSPITSQRRFLGGRDIRCRCMGCRRPARYGQLDHNDEHHDGGPTALTNLANLCVGHHTMKTETDWTVKQLPGGTLEWTSPLGFTYRDDPPTRVVFLPDGDPPPF